MIWSSYLLSIKQQLIPICLAVLSYLDELYRRIVSGQSAKIYGSELIKVPAPEFYVFYDGDDTSFDQQILKLSNAFESASENLELIVHVYNLGDGKVIY